MDITFKEIIYMIELLANFFEMLGTLLIAFAALRVHHRVLKESKIDRHATGEMKREQIAGMVGVVFIIFSFLVKSALIITR